MIGGWIRDRREFLKLSQTELGDRIEVSQNQISLWETDQQAPSDSHRRRLIEVLGPLSQTSGSSAAGEKTEPASTVADAKRAEDSSNKRATGEATKPLLPQAERMIDSIHACRSIGALDALMETFKFGQDLTGRLFRSLPRSNVNVITEAWLGHRNKLTQGTVVITTLTAKHARLPGSHTKVQSPTSVNGSLTLPKPPQVSPHATPRQFHATPLGGFVQTKGARGEVGKLVAIDGELAVVEYFVSPAVTEPKRISLPRSLVEPIAIPKQTLIYHQAHGIWRLGRVLEGGDSDVFWVQFPNGEPVAVPRDELRVRQPASNDDPTALLAAQITSSPHFAGARNRLNGWVAKQRDAYRGMTALATARIELHKHQLGAARRVLSDVIHRYLLADEVGLGKTIEAGLLVSQHLIDEGAAAHILIIVPDPLVAQWRRELAASFGIVDDPRIHLVPFTRLDETGFPSVGSPRPTLVVVDEAHCTATWAFPPTRGDANLSLNVGRARYRKLEALSKCPKLLLLSGTPVLHHEDGFLAMLHLLDPAAYDLADQEGFRKRVAARTRVADALAELRTDFQPGFLGPALDQLAQEAAADTELRARIDAVTGLFEAPPDLASAAIEELRTYLLERYQLHQRIIRTHRENPLVASHLPTRVGLTELPAGDTPIRAVVAERLEDWRRNVVDNGFDSQGPASAVFAQLVDRCLSHATQFVAVLEARAVDLRAGRLIPLFDAEADWLDTAASDVRDVAGRSTDERLSALVHYGRSPDVTTRRVVILTDAPETADEIVSRFRNDPDLRPRVIRFHARDSLAVQRFEGSAAAILVCDREAEEGLNLQRKPARIVFYDWIFDIGRLEQRIGRFDRLEGMKKIEFAAFRPQGAYEKAWVTLLSQTLDIFRRSVARLQYWLTDAMLAFRLELLELGPQVAFEALTARLMDKRTGIDATLKMLRRQDALDATAWRDDELDTFVAEATAAHEQAPMHAASFEHWLSELHFDIERQRDGVRMYAYRDASQGHSTLVPLHSLLPSLQRWVRPDGARLVGREKRIPFGPFVFDLEQLSSDASLLGIGHPFFDCIHQMMVGDDRSKAWALWRPHAEVAGVRVFLRFDVVIEADLSRATPIATQWHTLSSVRRRADEALPVEFRTVWLDRDGEPVVDAALLQALNRPYNRDADKNLRPDRWRIANERIDVADWGALVFTLRRRMVDSIENDKLLQRRRGDAVSRVQAIAGRAVRTLRSRAAHASAAVRQALEQAIELERQFAEALCAGVLEPTIRIDNVGAVLLAGSPLE